MFVCPDGRGPSPLPANSTVLITAYSRIPQKCTIKMVQIRLEPKWLRTPVRSHFGLCPHFSWGRRDASQCSGGCVASRNTPSSPMPQDTCQGGRRDDPDLSLEKVWDPTEVEPTGPIGAVRLRREPVEPTEGLAVRIFGGRQGHQGCRHKARAVPFD